MNKSIEVNNVWFSYNPEVPVLQGVSISFSPGTTAIIGENGAGKTTLMKLLNGLLKPTQGKVMVGELDTQEHLTSKLASQIGVVFQNPDDQIFKSKVIDEVMFGPLNIGMSEERARERALQALAEMELAGLEGENPYDLSYSERKRIGIASILAMDTNIVIFDEPTIGQDASGLRLIGSTIQRLKEENKTVLSIVHDMNFVSRYFDRVVTMAQGKIIADGTPEEVFIDLEALKAARVAPPSLIQLGIACKLSETPLAMERFVSVYKRERLNQEG